MLGPQEEPQGKELMALATTSVETWMEETSLPVEVGSSAESLCGWGVFLPQSWEGAAVDISLSVLGLGEENSSSKVPSSSFAATLTAKFSRRTLGLCVLIFLGHFGVDLDRFPPWSLNCQTSTVAAPLRHSQAARSKAEQAFPWWLVVIRYNLVNNGCQLSGRGIAGSARDSLQDLCYRSRGIEHWTRQRIGSRALTALVLRELGHRLPTGPWMRTNPALVTGIMQKQTAHWAREGSDDWS